MRGVSRSLRLFVAAFDALIALGLAAFGTAVPELRRAELFSHLAGAWGAALAALLAFVAVASDRPFVGWGAVGYLLWAALLSEHAFGLAFLALALSLAPVLPRPGGSLLRGLGMALVVAVLIGLVLSFPL